MTSNPQASTSLDAPPVEGTAYLNVGHPERFLSALGAGALIGLAPRRSTPVALVSLLVGGVLFQRAVSGHCPIYAKLGVDHAKRHAAPLITLSTRVTVNKPRHEVYAFWRDFENLARAMPQVSMSPIDERRTHWTIHTPVELLTLEWDSELTEDQPDEQIAWRTLPGSTVHHTGSVHFVDAPGEYGTEIHLKIQYREHFGDAGVVAGRLLKRLTTQLLNAQLRRIKSVIETGEAPSIHYQSSARTSQKPP